MSSINRQVRLAARPSGLPQASDWELTTGTVPAPGPGQFVVALSHLSVDPAMRGWMNAGVSYVPPVEIGAVMRAGGIGQVTVADGWITTPGKAGVTERLESLHQRRIEGGLLRHLLPRAVLTN